MCANPNEKTLPARSESATHPAHKHLDAGTLGECYAFLNTEFEALVSRMICELEDYTAAYYPRALERPVYNKHRRAAWKRRIHAALSLMLIPELAACQDALECEGLESAMWTPPGDMGELLAEEIMRRPVTNPHAVRQRQVREEEVKQRNKMGE